MLYSVLFAFTAHNFVSCSFSPVEFGESGCQFASSANTSSADENTILKIKMK
jgi:hypothetical protein